MKGYFTTLKHLCCLILSIIVLASTAFAAPLTGSSVSSPDQREGKVLTEDLESAAELEADEQLSDENEADLGTDEDESPSEEIEITPEVLDKVSRYCKFFDIEMSEDEEFIATVLDDMQERGWDDVPDLTVVHPSASISVVDKTSRFIPESKLADIIWTNNPIQPFNHVGIYTTTTKITEALPNGVATKKVNQKVDEYPFRLYKVVKKNSSSRFDVDTRRSVATWAKAQVGKKYDKNFYNNKKNTAKNNEKMNCSELVWKAWKFKASVDLDSNGGPGVYPNNIKKSSRTVCIYIDKT